MLGINLKGVDAAGNYPKPKAGAYIIRITKATNNPGKQRIEFEFDFAAGEFKDYYKGLYDRAHFWGGNFSKSYTEKAMPFLKGFAEAVQESNEDAKGILVEVDGKEDIDETNFPGKLIGMVVGEREYIGNDGTVKTKLDTYNATFITLADLKEGKYTVPEFVPLNMDQVQPATGNVVDTTSDVPEGFSQASEDDMPF